MGRARCLEHVNVKTSDSRSGSLSGANEKKPCDLTLVDTPLAPPGIVGTTFERDQHSVLIDYDPKAISDESVRQVAARLAPEVKRRFDKCVMRLDGRACEACALKLESKAQKIEGVRRARATFIGGVMSVTFDNAQLSPRQVIDRVRETRSPLRSRATICASSSERSAGMIRDTGLPSISSAL